MLTDFKMCWWWSLPPDRLRVALAIRSTLSVGSPAEIDINRLSTELATSRATVMRTLDELHRAGLIHIKTTAGRYGGTTAIIRRLEWLNHPMVEELETDYNQHLNSSSQHTSAPTAEQLESPLLDLPKSPKKDPDPSSDSPGRSSSPEIKQTLSAPTEPPDMFQATPPQSTAAATPRTRIDPHKIPSTAWRAADGLRARILKYKPWHRLGTRRWEGEAGDRLKWAHTFDLMVRIDKRGWLDISAVMLWLWPDDASKGPTQAAARFVIESADSLREKFDRVLDAQRRERTETTARTPDTRPAPTFKTWGGS